MPFFGGGGGGGGPAIYKYVNTTNIAGGTGALAAVTGNNNMGLGTGAGQDLLTGDENILIGKNAGQLMLIGNDNVVVGNAAFATGDCSGQVIIGQNAIPGNGANDSVIIGYTAAPFGTSIGNSVIIGPLVAQNLTTAAETVLIGMLNVNTVDNLGQTIAIGGFHQLGADVVDQGSILIGFNGIAAAHGILIGTKNGATYGYSGTNCVAIGNSAVAGSTVPAVESIAIGFQAKAAGNDSIVIGKGSSDGVFDHCIVIGEGETATAANQIVIGDSSYTDGITIGGVAYPPAASIGAAPITGMAISWTSATVINVAAGNAVINGVMHAFGAATLTSGSTMTDLNGAAVTLAANKAYHVYAWNNGGTLQFAVQNWSDATYGGTPVYDLANDYFKSPYATVGLNARRIGKFWTNGSGNILEFWQEGLGRNRRTEFLNAVQILSTGNSASLVTVGTLTPYSTLDDDNIIVGLNYVNGGTAQALAYLTPDSAGAALMEFSAISLGGSPNYANNIVMPNIGALYYKIVGGATTLNLFLSGFMEYI